MSLDLTKIINNIAAPVLVASPIRQSDGSISDFSIDFVNKEFTNAAGYVLLDAKTFNEIIPRISGSIPWFQMALDTIENKTYFRETFFSPNSWTADSNVLKLDNGVNVLRNSKSSFLRDSKSATDTRCEISVFNSSIVFFSSAFSFSNTSILSVNSFFEILSSSVV